MLETRNGDILRTIDSAIAVFHISDVDPGNPEEATRFFLQLCSIFV